MYCALGQLTLGWLVGWLVHFILLPQNEQALLPSCLDKWIVQALTKDEGRKEILHKSVKHAIL